MASENADAKKSEPKVIYTVLPQHMGGGPHGLGDPDDRTLRNVEKEVCISKIMKDRAAVEKCPDQVEAFGICGKTQGLMMPFKCRREAKALESCLHAAFNDPEFIESCTEQFLDERSEYRRTGIGKKQREYFKKREERVKKMVEELREQDQQKQGQFKQDTL